MFRTAIATTLFALAGAMSLAQDAPKTQPAGPALAPAPQLEPGQKWVFTFTNFGNDDRTDTVIALMKRAKAAGYNGMLVSDVKFDKWQLLGPELATNCKRFRAACTAEKMKIIAGVTPFGYTDAFLTHDPNLAEGLPVRNAVFVVKDGKLVPDAEGVALVNGSFEDSKGDAAAGWTMDAPGKMCFVDNAVASEGKCSIRMDNPGAGGKDTVCRLWQKIKVKPWHYYHVSAMVKTAGWTGKDMRLMGFAGNPDGAGTVLTFQPPAIKETMDWTRIDATIPSLGYSEISVYLGTWGGKEGKIWFDDVKIEPGGFVNVLRRDSLPLTVTSQDGKTTYVEGKDFSAVKDSKLVHDPNPGYFTLWHAAPVVTVPAGSALKDGQEALASYHFAAPAGKPGQLNMCMAEPKVYDIVKQQIEWVKANVSPDMYLMGHDEIRVGGWDDSCVASGKTPGQLLADNIRKCTQIIKQVDPGKPIVAWNDMFDPFHNAKDTGDFYLVKGKGPWSGSWEGLTSDVIIANWKQGGSPNSAESLKFFSDRGEQQLLAGYYDQDPSRIVTWLKIAKDTKGVVGVIYTTWKGDYSQLEKWIEHVNKFEAQK